MGVGAPGRSRLLEVKAAEVAALAAVDLVAVHQLALHAPAVPNLVATAAQEEVAVPLEVGSPLGMVQAAAPLVASSPLAAATAQEVVEPLGDNPALLNSWEMARY